MDRRAIWARNFRRFGLSDETSQRSTPHRRQQARFSQGDQDCRWRARRGGLLEPGQPERPVAASTVSRPSRADLAVPGQDRCQPLIDLVLGPLSGCGDESLQGSDPWPFDPEAEQVLTGQPQEQRGTVVLQGAVHEPGLEPGQVAGPRPLRKPRWRRTCRRCSVRVCPRRPYRASSPGATSICRATKVTTASGTVVRSSGQKPRKRSAPSWRANPRRLAGEAVRGICLRSARERVK